MDARQIEAVWFKKVADGHLYRAPNLWMFGPGRTYLVNDAQKGEIVQILKRGQLNRPLLSGLVFGIVLVVAVMVWAYFGYHDSEPGIADYGLLIVMVAVAVFVLLQVFSWIQFYRLSPVVSRLPRSNERISAGEMGAALRKSRSLKDLILAGASLAFLCVVTAFNAGLNLAFSLQKGHATFSLYSTAFVAILSGTVALMQFRRALRAAELLENPPQG